MEKTMTVSQERINIINKIANLLAKADSTTFEAEAESARKLAAKLMTTYEVKQEETESKTIVTKILNVANKRKNMRHASAMNVVSKYCGVYMVTSGNNYILCGKSEDVEATEYMFDVIWNQIVNMTEYWYKKNKKNPNVTAKIKNRYIYGLISGVQYNLDKINDNVFKYKQETGLVPVNKNKADFQKAEEFFNSDNKVKQRKNNVVADGAYRQGQQDSENIKMRHGVNNSNKTYALR